MVLHAMHYIVGQDDLREAKKLKRHIQPAFRFLQLTSSMFCDGWPLACRQPRRRPGEYGGIGYHLAIETRAVIRLDEENLHLGKKEMNHVSAIGRRPTRGAALQARSRRSR